MSLNAFLSGVPAIKTPPPVDDHAAPPSPKKKDQGKEKEKEKENPFEDA